jgi:hypothetical protein
MKQKGLILIALVVLVSMMVVPVMAETLTGTLGTTSLSSSSWQFDTNYATQGYLKFIYINDIENTRGTIALIREDNGTRPTFTGTTITGNTTTFTANTTGGVIIGRGTFGYARSFSGAGVESDGYQFWAFSEWNVTGLSGDKVLWINMDEPDGITLSVSGAKSAAPLASGKMALMSVAGYPAGSLLYNGRYTQNIDLTTYNEYTVTKPGGLGITGSVNKDVGGLTYTSQVFVYNYTTGGTMTSQAAVSALPFNFNVMASSIIIGIKDASGNYYNSSKLFTASTSPTPTPANVTSTVKILLDVRDAISGNLLQDTTTGIKNTTTGVWRNATLAYGIRMYDCTDPGFLYPLSVGQTIELAANKTGYEEDNITFVIPVADPGGYPATLWLTPTASAPTLGTVNFIIKVIKNYDHTPISSASVTLTTGVSPQYTNTLSTDVNGMVSFINVTASTSASVDIHHISYQSVSAYISGVTPNTTHKPIYEMILIGATPVTTVATAHPTTAAVSTYPVPTDANNNPITDPTLQGFAAFGVLVSSAYAIMQIVVGCVIIWLMWMTVYLITGGKIIDKIMRRGRR